MKLLNVLRYLLAAFMAYSGLQHFIKPDFYLVFVPEFLPFKDWIIILSGLLEIALGVLLLFKTHIAKFGAIGIFFLMFVFLPIHIIDVLVENPIIGTHEFALIRLALQFVFLVWSFGVFIFLKNQKKR